MRKIFSLIIVLAAFFLIFLLVTLSTIGIKTDKFNAFISKKINQTNNFLDLKLNYVKFKLDIKQLSLFLETSEPEIKYRKAKVPVENIKVYIDFVSLIKSEPKIKKIFLDLDKINIDELKKISITFKPSNITSFIHNKVIQGKLESEIEIYLNDKNKIDNFITRGFVSDFKANIFKNLNLEKTNFNFFADKTDILFKNISGETGPIKILDGDLKMGLSSEIVLESNFKSYLEINTTQSTDIFEPFVELEYRQNLKRLKADLNNSLRIIFDKTYKIKEYNIKSNGKLQEVSLNFQKPLTYYISTDPIKNISLKNSDLKINASDGNANVNISGNYSLNNSKYLKFNLDNNNNKNRSIFRINIDYDKLFNFQLINYNKPKDEVAKIFIDFTKENEKTNIDQFKFSHKKDFILLKGIRFKKNKFSSLDEISVKTSKDGYLNNDFFIKYGKKIIIKGKKFDAKQLPKILKQKQKNNFLSVIDKGIEIDFANISVPLSEELKNFKLIGTIKNGKFIKISSKGSFGENNFLDISMKNDEKNKKKYLEIYSDSTKPLLTEYSFFNGLTGGKLLYTSIIEKNSSNSKLVIEKFKVVDAPGMVKLLSLADLGGLADLAEGEGISFDTLEINMEQNKNDIKLNEILALGPSISVLMEGYQNSEITSLRGTLVPAKTLNKLISRIPVIGDIVIPKEVGEGLFGISFKMKGPPGKIKTTINPIRTVTPRFIQKIIDKNKSK
tara:strand:- start:8036 stop:10219 length:2184 start_codon:yes stop_codon:yes gene_type:complete